MFAPKVPVLWRNIPSTGEPLPVLGLGTWQQFYVAPSEAERRPPAPLEVSRQDSLHRTRAMRTGALQIFAFIPDEGASKWVLMVARRLRRATSKCRLRRQPL